jgi:hypothetical protein
MLGDEGGGWICLHLSQMVAGSLYPQFSGFSKVFFLQEFVQMAILDAEKRLVARAFGLRPERAEHQTLHTGVCKSPGNMGPKPAVGGSSRAAQKSAFLQKVTLSPQPSTPVLQCSTVMSFPLTDTVLLYVLC